MRHTVEQCEQRRRPHSHEQRRPHRQCHRQAQGQHRRSNPAFQCRQRQAFKTQYAAYQHGADERAGQGPTGGAFLLGGPQTDGDHRQQVVDATQGVADTGHQAVVAMARVSEGQGWGQQQGGGGEEFFEAHGQVP